jgi:predicted dithiol-disulfide oxidoreductase (DUF899 family)
MKIRRIMSDCGESFRLQERSPDDLKKGYAMTGTIRKIGQVEREIVSDQEWRSARQDILAREKALTRAHDELAAERRRQPWMKVDKDYRFTGPSGELTLGDLFDNRHQLVVYHHMLKPADPSPCSGCGMVGDQIPHLAHLQRGRPCCAILM